jgi:hypothetical protein
MQDNFQDPFQFNSNQENNFVSDIDQKYLPFWPIFLISTI